jgi:serine/threonine protein kinase
MIIEDVRLPSCEVLSFNSPPYSGYVAEPCCPDNLIEFLNTSLEEVFRSGSKTLLGPQMIDTGRRAARVAIGRDGCANWYFAKKYDEFIPSDDPELARRCYLGAVRGWNYGWMLIEHGVPTPKPVAIVKHCRITNNAAFLLILEWLDGYQSVALEMLELDGKRDVAAERQQLIDGLVALILRMHSQGIFHGDLNPGNILVKPVFGKVEYDYMVTDLDFTRIGRPFDEEEVIEDLAWLISTFSGPKGARRRLIFPLDRYIDGVSSKRSCDWRPNIIEAIETRSKQMSRRYAAQRNGLLSTLFAAAEEQLGISQDEPGRVSPEDSGKE